MNNLKVFWAFVLYRNVEKHLSWLTHIKKPHVIIGSVFIGKKYSQQKVQSSSLKGSNRCSTVGTGMNRLFTTSIAATVWNQNAWPHPVDKTF